MSVQQFLFREARLLDERRFDEWLALFSDDCFYWMPTRFNRLRDGIDETWQVDKETEGLDGLAYFEDNKQILRRRVERLKTGMAWAEDPPSRTRHFVSNIEARDGERGHTYNRTLRIDPHVFNNDGDVDTFLAAIDEYLSR